MKRWIPLVLVVACVSFVPIQASAQSWSPFGTGYWSPGAGQSGGYGLVTDSETCVVNPMTCPWGVTYGGAELVGGPTSPEALTSIAFSYKPDTTGAGGGSPRLVIQFSDGGSADLRPLNWTAGVWELVDGLAPSANTGWDNYGGSCGFLYNTTWAGVLACHVGTSITGIFLVNDSGWLHDPEQVILDGANINGIPFGPTKDSCKKNGWVALGFRNQGQCVSSFVGNRR
jgi:hypothetical protein